MLLELCWLWWWCSAEIPTIGKDENWGPVNIFAMHDKNSKTNFHRAGIEVETVREWQVDAEQWSRFAVRPIAGGVVRNELHAVQMNVHSAPCRYYYRTNNQNLKKKHFYFHFTCGW